MQYRAGHIKLIAAIRHFTAAYHINQGIVYGQVQIVSQIGAGAYGNNAAACFQKGFQLGYGLFGGNAACPGFKLVGHILLAKAKTSATTSAASATATGCSLW